MIFDIKSALRSTTALAIGASFGLASVSAAAQDSGLDEGQSGEGAEGPAIIVTGFRASVENSIAEKRDLDFIADVISADDIAGLPDTSIAESLARLPGVTAQRTGGQASAINIRGLSQDLVSASLNGREQVATSGDRVIEFNQYPSELIRQAAVYKTPMASLIAGGIAGRVELETVRPLDNIEDFKGVVNIRGLYNDRASQSPDVGSWGYRASASIQAKLADDTLGIAIGYSRLHQPNVATRFIQFDYPAPGTAGAPAGEDLDGDGSFPDQRPFGYEANQAGGRETRDGVIAVVQWEPSDNLRLLVDGYYSKFDSDVFRRGFRVNSVQSADTEITDAVVIDNALVGGTLTNQFGPNFFALSLESINQSENREDELYTIAGNLAYDFTDNFTGAIDVSYSKAESYLGSAGINLRPYTDVGGGTLVGQQFLPGLLSTSYLLNGVDLPTLSDFSVDFTDADINLLDGQFVAPQADADEMFALAADFDLAIDGNFISSIEFGGRYASREVVRNVTYFPVFGIPGGPIRVPDNLLSVGGFEGDFAANGFVDFLVADIDEVFNLAFGNTLGINQPTDQSLGFTVAQSFIVEEDVTAGYAQINFDTTAGGLPFRGNIGARVVHTDQQSTSPDGQFTAGDDFIDFLPSANFILEISPEDVLRLSYTRQISRPNLFDLRVALSAAAGPDGVPAGSGGNPSLRPFRAQQFDISYEHYFGNDGIFALAAYYKDLKSFIIGGVVPEFDYAAAGIPIQPPADPTIVVQDSGPLFAPINGDGGYVWGIEANLSYSFQDILPAPLDGLGVLINYAYAESDLQLDTFVSGGTLSLPLPGLSKHVFNPTVYYQKGGFETRVGARYRSTFVSPQLGLSEQTVGNTSETVIDAQVSYAFPEDSSLGGLKLLVQGNNLTDEPTRSYWGQEHKTGTLQYFGRTVFFGASFEF